ncbi:VCBS repeat-containing protein [Mucilaginibacter sp. JRF]|nr:VCBS repeat-containing protein [Mucilaginibacter sp. JRF]
MQFINVGLRSFALCVTAAFAVQNVSLAQQPLFRQLDAKQTGITFANAINETESLNVLSYEYFYNGAGVAAGDINNDGLIDLMFTANMQPNKLYLNLGGLKFKDITKEASKELAGRSGSWKTGVTMADVNGDGLLDIYVCYSGKVENDQRRNQLFINQGNNKFKEEAAVYGLDDPGYSTQAAFFDYDNDGDLDMFLLNHNIKKIDNMELARYKNETDMLAGNKLFENNNNKFTDVTNKAGIFQNPLTFGLGIAIADINKDGWQDVYVTNDYNEPDYVYLNNHNKTFTDASKKMLRHLSHFSMGVDIADYNNDGLPDILTLDMLPEDNHRQKSLQLEENYESFELMLKQDLYKQYMRNMLQLNNGDGTFSEIANMAGVAATDWSWCPLIADFDNDGYKDIFISNGYLRDYTNKDFLRYWGDYKIKKAMSKEPFLLMDLIKAMPSTKLPNYVFSNNHNLTFSNKQTEWGLTESTISSGAVYADLDNDGDLDLIVNNINQPASIYENTRSPANNNYIAIKLNGKKPNSNAVGAKVYLYSQTGTQYQEVNPNRGYLSSTSTILNFGLGDAKKIDSLKIIWPDQMVQVISNPTVNQRLQVEQDATVPFKEQVAVAKTIFTKQKPLIDFNQQALAINDFKRQLLMMFMYSKTSPVMITADVNGDGLQDIYISSADNTTVGKVYLQQQGGTFKETELKRGNDQNIGTVAAAAFFDANGDKFPDLYLGKGGYATYEANTGNLEDELYINDGKGNFTWAPTALPSQTGANSKSCVRPFDYDNDGDLDLFVGGRVIPGKYPTAPESFWLLNDGQGKFTIASTVKPGMVTDAQWVDLNNDKRADLVVCGEFMPIMVYLNTKDGFVDKTADYFATPQKGIWMSLSVADVNADGKPDIIAGNMGLNSALHATDKQPAELYYADFDGNGSIDPFLNFYVQGKSYPFVSRDELNEQIYPMRRRFASYSAYSDATIKEIFNADELAKAGILSINTTETTCFINNAGKFEVTTLPTQAQFTVTTKIITGDFDNDKHTDILLLGNHSDNRLKFGSMDAGYGTLLKGDGKGKFTYVPQPESGLSVTGDVKSAIEVKAGKDKYLVVGTAEGPLQFYKY